MVATIIGTSRCRPAVRNKVVILVFGKTGQVATELQRFGDIIALDRSDVELSNPLACYDAIRHYAPKAVINAAAYTAVDKAENEEAFATVINGDAPTEMAKACLELGIPFVHISTDYVFGGSGDSPCKPDHPTFPNNAYGRSKLAGESGIRASGAVHAILRTSWVVSAHGTNFIKTMLHLSETRDKLSVVVDQIGGPTPARDIASACLHIAKQLLQDPSKSGTYHFSGAPDVSWALLSKEIFVQAGKSVTVTPILTADYPTLAPRPLNSRMDCSDTVQAFGILRPDWRDGLSAILTELEVIS
jgi:dTDP-4-dehydrorhamnose reductase